MIRFFTGLGAIMVFSLVGWLLNLLFNYIGKYLDKKMQPIKEHKWYIKFKEKEKTIGNWIEVILGAITIILILIFVVLVICGIGQIIIG